MTLSNPLLRPRFRLPMPSLLLASMAALALLIAGCASVGKEFPADKVPLIRIGQTTQQEVREMFGSPWRVGLEDGKPTWTYGSYYYSAGGQKQAQDLVIRFDDRNRVSSYTYSTTDHDK